MSSTTPSDKPGIFRRASTLLKRGAGKYKNKGKDGNNENPTPNSPLKTSRFSFLPVARAPEPTASLLESAAVFNQDISTLLPPSWIPSPTRPPPPPPTQGQSQASSEAPAPTPSPSKGKGKSKVTVPAPSSSSSRRPASFAHPTLHEGTGYISNRTLRRLLFEQECARAQMMDEGLIPEGDRELSFLDLTPAQERSLNAVIEAEVQQRVANILSTHGQEARRHRHDWTYEM